ncbi:hypothetical protein EYC80_003655 [Monilinia laxa]|uniref:FAD-binding PCMH-type domain-containing protein n=1 Tax=Monilinia laxa TaxID=61186 RepID=A0A5N6KKM9_MONLA|nr:hypothetical protein EYC80_003655 [Monilinia laxa]
MKPQVAGYVYPGRSESCCLPAKCIISPTSTEEVSTIMKIISFLHVLSTVRSGSHSPNPNWASIGSNGILISTTNLDTLTVSPDNSIASVGPELKWGAVYEALDPYGVSVAGEVVLASGEIVNANAENNSDLLWALKGGGTNFGDGLFSKLLAWSYILQPATYPDTFAPFATIPNGVVTIPPTNATVNTLTKIFLNTFSPASALHVYRLAASLIMRNSTMKHYPTFLILSTAFTLIN